jgi:hypothetical protein
MTSSRPLAFKAVLLVLLCFACPGQSIPLDEAASAFALAHTISAADAGKTWGVEICGPILFGDTATNDVVANQPDKQGLLKQNGSVWQDRLPKEMRLANTALEWGGVRWTTVMWPLPADTRARAQLLGHECFHRIQPSIHLPSNDVMNGHMDSMQGRIWMLLEWRALERALGESGEARKQAISDALRFRQYRRSLFKGSPESENALEMNEGLAEYTGVRLANVNPADRRAAAIYMLRDGPGRSSLVRSFAYASGPAYGVLLDESGADWRSSLTPASDLGVVLARSYRVPPVEISEKSATQRARDYGGEVLIEVETVRARKAQNELAVFKSRFVDGPVLILPVLGDFSFGFNPNGLVPLNESATLYRWLRVTDRWGVLEANGGVLIREAGKVKRIVVPAPKNTTGQALAGDDWKLDLKPGFKLVAGPRDGDWIVTAE